MNTAADSRRFYIKTLGCKVNQYETQVMRELLANKGFEESPDARAADIYILNTCTVTHRADSESRYLINLFHRTNPNAEIVVTGCYVERNAEGVFFSPGVKHIVGNRDKHKIASILTNGNVNALATPSADDIWPQVSDFKDHAKAFIMVQDGCSNYCSYCKIPLVRGRPRSKPIKDILMEARTLIGKNFKELVLTGICLGMWGKDLSEGAGLIDVINAFDLLEGDFRIRLSSIEPKYVTDELIGRIASDRRLCKHLHIPLQSGDDGILKRMKRPYSQGEFKDLITRIRSAIPEAAISTDVMVGFPGEGEENFCNTLDTTREILPVKTHIFPYSKRDGTLASTYKDEVGSSDIRRRYTRMWVAALEASYIYRAAFLGRTLEILVETKRDRASGMLEGYSDNYIKVLLEGPDSLMGNIVPVKLEGMTLEKTLGSAVSAMPQGATGDGLDYG